MVKHASSRVFGLPAELRNTIYSLVLVESSQVVISVERRNQPPALLATCTQVREEAASIYYSLNHFHFLVSDAESDTPLLWLSPRNDQVLRSIKKFTIEYSLTAHVLADMDNAFQSFEDAWALGDGEARARALAALAVCPEWTCFHALTRALGAMWLEAGAAAPETVFEVFVEPHDTSPAPSVKDTVVAAFRQQRLRGWKRPMETRVLGVQRAVGKDALA